MQEKGLEKYGLEVHLRPPSSLYAFEVELVHMEVLISTYLEKYTYLGWSQTVSKLPHQEINRVL